MFFGGYMVWRESSFLGQEMVRFDGHMDMERNEVLYLLFLTGDVQWFSDA
jgi:hypothetical protein